MLARIGRCLPLGGALSVVLGFVSLAWAGGGVAPGGLVIVAPVSVMAGNPIIGYVTGFVPPCNVTGEGEGGNLPGSPASGSSDPLDFTFETHETMSGTIVIIRANDARGDSGMAPVAVQ